MIAKALELRDEGTFVPILCVDMNPHVSMITSGVRLQPMLATLINDAQRYLLRRCGYACDGRPNIIMTRLDGSGQATNDPFAWRGGRSYFVAHDYIIDHWQELKDGDVVDVQFILGETKEPKKSEREGA